MSKKVLRILSWNVNGIRAVSGKGFRGFLAGIPGDILCLQETKAHPGQLSDDLVRPLGYRTYWNNPVRRGYAGVAVYTRAEPLAVEKDFARGKFDTEGRMLLLRFEDFTLVNVYFPNGRMSEERLRYKLDFYNKFLDFLDGMTDRNIVVCGDFNTAHREIDLARPKENSMFSGFLPEEREWIDKLVTHGFIDTFREFDKDAGKYSWWDYKSRARERNVGWRIDYFFITAATRSRLKKAFLMPEITGSDHCPVGIELEIGDRALFRKSSY